MTINQFAEKFRLRARRDECADKIIPGRRGHLYFAGGELCLMVIDGIRVTPAKWRALGGKLWLGDIGTDSRGRRIQDVKITGIPMENAPAAIRIVRARVKRQMSEAALAHLARIREGVARTHRIRPGIDFQRQDGPNPQGDTSDASWRVKTRSMRNVLEEVKAGRDR